MKHQPSALFLFVVLDVVLGWKVYVTYLGKKRRNPDIYSHEEMYLATSPLFPGQFQYVV